MVDRNQYIYKNIFWFFYILLIYFYLYTCMFYGGPFYAFDHENYIKFLNNPTPFLFEPLYYIIALFFNLIFTEEYRFPLIFFLFTIIPLIILLKKIKFNNYGLVSLITFASILTKSFYIGFISQRFFFTELLVVSIIIRSYKKNNYLSFFITGLIHFSAFSIFFSNLYFSKKFNFRLLLSTIFLLFILFLLSKSNLIFTFGGYDYTRYLDSDSANISIFTIIQSLILILLIYLFSKKQYKPHLILLVFCLLIVKILFLQIEVFSRIFQIVTDVILIYFSFSGKRSPIAVFVFCFGFSLLQIFFVNTSIETRVIHANAINNAVTKIFFK